VGRIVVNIEPGKAAAGTRPKGRRRWLKILAVFAICVVALIGVLAIAGFFSWRRFQASPEYSLTLLIDAAQRQDTAEMAKRMDDDEIAKNMIATASQKAVARYGSATSPATQQQIDAVTSSALPRLKLTIHDEVVREITGFAVKAEDKPFIFLLLTVPSMVKITTEGDTAKATASVNDRPIELTLRRDADRWKVVAVNDYALVQRVVDSFVKELPPIGAFDSNSPLFKNPGKPRKKRR